MSDLSVERIAQALETAGVQARPFRYLSETSSTNDDALEWLGILDDPFGAFIVADVQNKGRGRLGRAWLTEPGGALTFTYLLVPPIDLMSRVSMLGALAVCEAVEQIVGKSQVCRIKWPNDVQVNGLKICGVLPEASWDGAKLRGVALGIGVNVRLDFAGTDFESTATSLEPALGVKIDRAALLAAVISRLDHWSEHIELPALYDSWLGRLNMLGKVIRHTGATGEIVGTAEEVDPTGALWVRETNGKRHRIIAGDISLG